MKYPYVLTSTIFAGILILFCPKLNSQELNPLPPNDSISLARAKQAEALESFLGTVRKIGDPISRFMVYTRRVIEINKFIADPATSGSINFNATKKDGSPYGLGEVPDDPEEIKRIQAEIKKNIDKFEEAAMMVALRSGILDAMREDSLLVDEKYRAYIQSVIEVLH